MRESAMRRSIESLWGSDSVDKWQSMDRWLADPSTSAIAWQVLSRSTDPSTLAWAATRVHQSQQRREILHRLVSLGDIGADVWIALAARPDWRSDIGELAAQASDASLRRWFAHLRSDDRIVRVAASFILANAPEQSVNTIATELVARGIDRGPAFMAILARPTPQRLRWLASAASDPSLQPSLFSAQQRFRSHQPLLAEWTGIFPTPTQETDDDDRPDKKHTIETIVDRFRIANVCPSESGSGVFGRLTGPLVRPRANTRNQTV